MRLFLNLFSLLSDALKHCTEDETSNEQGDVRPTVPMSCIQVGRKKKDDGPDEGPEWAAGFKFTFHNLCLFFIILKYMN